MGPVAYQEQYDKVLEYIASGIEEGATVACGGGPPEPRTSDGYFVLPTGRIVAIGDGADRDSMGTPVAVGDRVVWTPEPCSSCWVCTIEKDPAACPSKSIGMFTSSETPPHFHGTFAEYSYVRPRAGRLRVPDELDSAWASAASCAMRTVIKAVEKAGRIDHTDSVVVQGSGPLGLFTTAIMAMQHTRQLIIIGAPKQRLAIAEQWVPRTPSRSKGSRRQRSASTPFARSPNVEALPS